MGLVKVTNQHNIRILCSFTIIMRRLLFYTPLNTTRAPKTYYTVFHGVTFDMQEAVRVIDRSWPVDAAVVGLFACVVIVSFLAA